MRYRIFLTSSKVIGLENFRFAAFYDFFKLLSFLVFYLNLNFFAIFTKIAPESIRDDSQKSGLLMVRPLGFRGVDRMRGDMGKTPKNCQKKLRNHHFIHLLADCILIYLNHHNPLSPQPGGEDPKI